MKKGFGAAAVLWAAMLASEARGTSGYEERVRRDAIESIERDRIERLIGPFRKAFRWVIDPDNWPVPAPPALPQRLPKFRRDLQPEPAPAPPRE